MTPEQCKEKCPLLNIDDILGGLWIPGDGVGDPYQTCLSIIAESKKMGNISNLFFTGLLFEGAVIYLKLM